jgi:hypothetical protein
MKLLNMQSPPASSHFIPLRSKYSPQHPPEINKLIKSELVPCSKFSITFMVSYITFHMKKMKNRLKHSSYKVSIHQKSHLDSARKILFKELFLGRGSVLSCSETTILKGLDDMIQSVYTVTFC